MFDPTKKWSREKIARRVLLLLLPLCFAGAFGCSEAFNALLMGTPYVDPESLTFQAVEGTTPAAQEVTFTCNFYDAATNTREYCDATISSDQTWLKIGVDSFNGYAEHDVSVDTTGLAVGTYTGKLKVEVALCVACDSADLNVELTITAAAQDAGKEGTPNN